MTTADTRRMFRKPPRHDHETGLPQADALVDDLDRGGDAVLALELVALRGPDGWEEPFVVSGDALLPARVGEAMRAAAEGHGGRAYRVGGAVYGIVTVADGLPRTVVPALQRRLRSVSLRLSAGLVHGRVTVPFEAADGREALRIAYDRLRARSSWQPLSPARQARDVLLQLLAERRLTGAGARRPQVAAHAVAVGRLVGLGLDELDEAVRAAELQDVGLLVLPDSILLKNEPLSADDWDVIHNHPIAGERILAAAPALAPVARLVRSCYERFDGTGYPDGLKGEEIPLGARVIAVCVAFDAMVSGRPYRPARTPSEALAELDRCAGRQFDPMVVDAFWRTSGAASPRPVGAAA